MVNFLDFVSLGLQAMLYVIYFTIVVHFLNQKTNYNRLKFLLVVVAVLSVIFLGEGVFSGIFYVPQWTFILTPMSIIVVLAVADFEMIVSRTTALALFIIFLFSLSSSIFIAHLIAYGCYIFLSFQFIYSSFRIIHKGFSGR